eukprot:CAMPEP_0202451106 /NCGR_PEP_ID=MMETSP1360-20130828/9604_1 /ASSEMBLY_ACC=CAM_ASM_000848 /TAXON_ID=515479 /ORGANISM="Licmophora paradoxa, Strain CCMP2313" /LENGTH=93 /DNA_ID=CAMNT_0049069581 /DNA_START=251 /DNA_END=530 /DNA_ORIENTATION=-
MIGATPTTTQDPMLDVDATTVEDGAVVMVEDPQSFTGPGRPRWTNTQGRGRSGSSCAQARNDNANDESSSNNNDTPGDHAQYLVDSADNLEDN